jgi:hypothetical protein
MLTRREVIAYYNRRLERLKGLAEEAVAENDGSPERIRP